MNLVNILLYIISNSIMCSILELLQVFGCLNNYMQLCSENIVFSFRALICFTYVLFVFLKINVNIAHYRGLA